MASMHALRELGPRDKAAVVAIQETAASARQTLDRISSWFCKPGTKDAVDRDAQMEKLEMFYEGLRSEYQSVVGLDDLRQLDDVLSRNAEEFVGALTVRSQGSGIHQPTFMTGRHHQ